jgi:hypothetical protein
MERVGCRRYPLWAGWRNARQSISLNLRAMLGEVGASEGGGTEGLISEIKNFARLGEGVTEIVRRRPGPGKYPSTALFGRTRRA